MGPERSILLHALLSGSGSVILSGLTSFLIRKEKPVIHGVLVETSVHSIASSVLFFECLLHEDWVQMCVLVCFGALRASAAVLCSWTSDTTDDKTDIVTANGFMMTLAYSAPALLQTVHHGLLMYLAPKMLCSPSYYFLYRSQAGGVLYMHKKPVKLCVKLLFVEKLAFCVLRTVIAHESRISIGKKEITVVIWKILQVTALAACLLLKKARPIPYIILLLLFLVFYFVGTCYGMYTHNAQSPGSSHIWIMHIRELTFVLSLMGLVIFLFGLAVFSCTEKIRYVRMQTGRRMGLN